jgi:hypothetical protein
VLPRRARRPQLWDDKSLANVDFPYIWRKAMPSSSNSKIRCVRWGAGVVVRVPDRAACLTQRVDGVACSLARVNFMERKFLELLQYNVNVKPRWVLRAACVPREVSQS